MVLSVFFMRWNLMIVGNSLNFDLVCRDLLVGPISLEYLVHILVSILIRTIL